MNTRNSNHRRVHPRRGAATVEVAFTLPIILLFIFGGYELARMNAIQNTIENATYEAARESMLPGADLAKVQTAANDVLDTMGINNASVDMTPGTITPGTTEVSITLTVPVADNSLGVAKLFTSGNLTSTMTFQRELQPGNF